MHADEWSHPLCVFPQLPTCVDVEANAEVCPKGLEGRVTNSFLAGLASDGVHERSCFSTLAPRPAGLRCAVGFLSSRQNHVLFGFVLSLVPILKAGAMIC